MPVLSATKGALPLPDGWFSGLMRRLDIRIKMATLFFLSLTLIFMQNPLGLSLLGALSMLCLLSMKRYRIILVLYGIMLTGWLFSLGFSKLIGGVVPAMGAQDSLQTLIPFLRMWPLLNMALSVALSMETGNAMKSLKSMRLPRIIYLPVMVTLRFIPGFINDIKQLRDCLLLRGIALSPWLLVRHPQKSLRLLFVPMVIRALKLADELAIAAELKRVGYGAGPQKSTKTLLRRHDYTFFALSMFALITAWNMPGTDVVTGGSSKHLQHINSLEPASTKQDTQ